MSMSIQNKFFALLSVGALVALTFAGAATVATEAPAEAAPCSVSNLGWWSVKNVSCGWARHVNLISGGEKKYAPWVRAGSTSDQGVCWANAIGYGFQYSN